MSLLVKGVQVDRLCSHSRWRATDRVDKRYQCTSERYTSASIGRLRASTSPTRVRDPIEENISARQVLRAAEEVPDKKGPGQLGTSPMTFGVGSRTQNFVLLR
jgi:hypothetical protein